MQSYNPLLEKDIYNFVDHLNVTVPSMSNWFILLDVKTSSNIEFTLTSRSRVTFLSKCSGAGVCLEKKDQRFKEDNIYSSCLDGLTGDKCESLQCSMDCGLNGICSDGQCRCFEGWTEISCNKSAFITGDTVCMETFMSEQGKSV